MLIPPDAMEGESDTPDWVRLTRKSKAVAISVETGKVRTGLEDIRITWPENFPSLPAKERADLLDKVLEFFDAGYTVKQIADAMKTTAYKVTHHLTARRREMGLLKKKK